MIGDESTPPKPLVWVGPARRELKALPRKVQRTMGVALWFAQNGRVHPAAVPMRGSRFTGVIEVRAKATTGIATPRRVLDLIEARWRQARAIHRQYGSHS